MPAIPDPGPAPALARHLKSALELLDGGPLSDDAIHRFRKELKKARASVRLLREVVGKPACAEANRALRDAARPLSAARDARVMLDTLAGLVRRRRLKLPRAQLVLLRRELREQHRRLLAMADAAGTKGAIREALLQVRRASARWRVPRDSQAAWWQKGVERIHKRGRKALSAARSEGTDEALHELRKQVKYLGAALGVFAPPDERRARKVIDDIDAIADALGIDHDLAVLAHRVPLDPGSDRAIRRHRGRLQKKGLERARDLFSRKAKALANLATPDPRESVE